MVLRSRQKMWHKIAFSWVTILSLVFVMFILTKGVFGMYQKNVRASERAQDALIELAKVEKREASLSKSLGHIKTSRGVEEELRRKFDVSREGEHLLVIVDKEVEPEAEQEASSWFGGLWRKLVQ